MDKIKNVSLAYRGTEMTIIAAAEHDERHRLLGVGVKKVPPCVAEIGKTLP